MRFFVLVLLLALTGCVDLTQQPRAALGSSATTGAQQPNVYLSRGWLGIWSRGIDTLAQRATAELGLRAVSLGQPETRKLAALLRSEYTAGRATGPLVLGGHSMGADDQIRVAQELHRSGVAVDLLLLIDPNAPPVIPPNVKRCVNFYKSQPGRDALPIFRGVRVRAADPARTRVENIDLRTSNIAPEGEKLSHFNISQTRGVQDLALAEIARVLPRRRR
jgi:hypothetical protein